MNTLAGNISQQQDTTNFVWLTVRRGFKDGNLGAAFKALGYNPVWARNEKRYIPQSLARQCESSGAILAIPDETSFTRAFTPPEAKPITGLPQGDTVVPDPVTLKKAQFAGERFVKVVSLSDWRDGSLSEQFEAIDRPPKLGRFEIVELPLSLVEILKTRDAKLTTAADQIAQHEGHYQLRFEGELRAWHTGRENLARNLAQYAEREAQRKAATPEAKIDELQRQLDELKAKKK